MQVSTRVEYGLIALTDIVIYGENNTSVSAYEIAHREHISHKYLEQILLLLRQAGFIRAQKGNGGGYALACSPDMISLSDVLNALDMTILADMDAKNEEGLGAAVNECFWDRVNDNLTSFTASIKLSDIANHCRNSSKDKWDLYVI